MVSSLWQRGGSSNAADAAAEAYEAKENLQGAKNTFT